MVSNRKSYLEFLKNKRVILVGPSNSLIESNNGNLIDSYDIVVRVNRGMDPIEKHAKDIGKRTDILYNCMLETPDQGGSIDINRLVDNNVSYIVTHSLVSFEGKATAVMPSYIDKNKIKNIKKNMGFHIIDHNFYNSISSQVKCRPNTGNIAIYHLLKYPIKELFITGYSFYLDGFMDGYKNHVDSSFINKAFNSKRHNQKNQWQFLKYKKSKDSRIKTDKFLTKILALEKFPKNNKIVIK